VAPNPDAHCFGTRHTCLGFELAWFWPSHWNRGGRGDIRPLVYWAQVRSSGNRTPQLAAEEELGCCGGIGWEPV